MDRRLICTVEKDFDLAHERVSRPREMMVRYGGECVDCCIPAGERTLDYLEELEWSDEDVIVESSREPSQQRSEPMQTDEVEQTRESVQLHVEVKALQNEAIRQTKKKLQS